MSIFEAISSLSKLAESDELGKSATAIGEAAAALPVKLDRIVELLVSMDNRLMEISLGLDSLSDPIKRPPFRVGDVEAAMRGQWPPRPELEYPEGLIKPESFDVPRSDFELEDAFRPSWDEKSPPVNVVHDGRKTGT